MQTVANGWAFASTWPLLATQLDTSVLLTHVPSLVEPILRFMIAIMLLLGLERALGCSRRFKIAGAGLLLCAQGAALLISHPLIYRDQLLLHDGEITCFSSYIRDHHPDPSRPPTVYWPMGRLEHVWHDLSCCNYFAQLQVVGSVFRRATALETRRRADLVRRFETDTTRHSTLWMSQDQIHDRLALFGLRLNATASGLRRCDASLLRPAAGLRDTSSGSTGLVRRPPRSLVPLRLQGVACAHGPSSSRVDHCAHCSRLWRTTMRVAIIGAGPAGLAAGEALSRRDVQVEVFEASDTVGGMARSFALWGQTVDLGPHRFFSQDPTVNKFWLDVVGADVRMVDRLTRIFYRDRFFHYPLEARNALWNMGAVRGRAVRRQLCGPEGRSGLIRRTRGDVRGLGSRAIRSPPVRDLLPGVQREALGHLLP